MPDGEEAAYLDGLKRTSWPHLTHLYIHYTAHVFLWLGTAQLPALTHLMLRDACPVEDWPTLANAPWLGQLQHLTLEEDDAQGLFATLPLMKQLQHLGLHACDARDLQAAARCPNITSLDLGYKPLTQTQAQALINSDLPARLQTLTFEAQDEDTTPLSEEMRLRLHDAPWSSPDIPAYIASRYSWFFTQRRHQQNTTKTLQDLQTRTTLLDFDEVYRRCLWLHPDHRAEVLDHLSTVQHWSPGPLACMQRSPYHEHTPDHLSSATTYVLPLLWEEVRRAYPTLKNWLDEIPSLLHAKRTKNHEPKAWQRWSAQAPQDIAITTHLTEVVRWHMVREMYVEWKRLRALNQALTHLKLEPQEARLVDHQLANIFFTNIDTDPIHSYNDAPPPRYSHPPPEVTT